MKTVLKLSVFVTIFVLTEAHVFDDYLGLHQTAKHDSERFRKFSEQEARTYTKFWLYTRKNPHLNDSQELKINNTGLLDKSFFNVSHPVRFLIHGLINNKESRFNTLITGAYLKKGEFNVIVVDWGALSENELTMFWTYDTVASSVKYIGRVLGEFAIFLNERKNVSYESMYLVGHSLGSHIAGFAGQTVKPHQFRTIFALDPAGPKFVDVPIDERLDETDAYYVESIQTDCFGFLPLGYEKAIGHASFFPNFGTDQPGCNMIACSHTRAFAYFAESITSPKPFYAQQCLNYGEIESKHCTSPKRHIIMGGEPAQEKRRGVFYVHTNVSTPYRLEQIIPTDAVVFHFSNSENRDGSTGKLSEILDTDLETSHQTRILVCDYSEGNNLTGAKNCDKIKGAYLSQYGVNVIVVDWDNIIKQKWLDVEINYEDIARVVARLIKTIRNLHHISFDQIYMIGEKIGAHIANLVAKEIAPKKVDTLFVLDYNGAIDRHAARYVESIQSRSTEYNGHSNIFVKYDREVSLCEADSKTCSHRTAVDIFVHTLQKTDKYMVRICETKKHALAKNCSSQDVVLPFGGEPSYHNQKGAFLLQYDFKPMK